jgi:hypothetical protein
VVVCFWTVDGETSSVGNNYIIGERLQHQCDWVSAAKDDRQADISAAMFANQRDREWPLALRRGRDGQNASPVPTCPGIR